MGALRDGDGVNSSSQALNAAQVSWCMSVSRTLFCSSGAPPEQCFFLVVFLPRWWQSKTSSLAVPHMSDSSVSAHVSWKIKPYSKIYNNNSFYNKHCYSHRTRVSYGFVGFSTFCFQRGILVLFTFMCDLLL